MTRHRLGVAAAAAIPLAALLVFFLYPVGGMVARGFWPDGAFAPGAVVEVLGRPRVGRVLWFTLWSASAGTVLALLLALLAHHIERGTWLWRLCFFLPFLLPSTVAGNLWQWLFNPGTGMVNHVFGLDAACVLPGR